MADEESTSTWQTIVNKVLSIVEYFLKIFYNKSNETSNQSIKNKKLQEVKDEAKVAIEEAHNEKKLDDIRKLISK